MLKALCCTCLPGYTNLPFRWFQYLKDTESVAAPVNLFNKVTPAPDSPPRRDRFRNSGVAVSRGVLTTVLSVARRSPTTVSALV